MRTPASGLLQRGSRVLTVGVTQWRATVIGIVLVAVVTASVGPLGDSARPVQALALVVPVVVAAVLGGHRPAYAVAVAAALAFVLVLPPVGSVRVRVAEDATALAVFGLVAVVVATLVSRRIETLAEVERQRAALLRAVSHDLRTPLASIRAAASDLAVGDALPPPTATRFAEIIGEEADRLDRLVANLLSLGRIEAGAFQPALDAVDLAEIIDAATRRLAPLFASVTVRLDVAEALPLVRGDHTQLDQLVTNLLENAARHSPPGTTVTVAAAGERERIVMAVADQGPGVPPDEAAVLFEPFRTGRIPGVGGVGLAICKAVVDAHDGTIAVGATPEGGAVFTVTLPRE
jgi:two-component system sensor histidine kinase KdpD